jgi:hypothetical protein
MNLRLSVLLVVMVLIFGGTFLVIRLTDSGSPTERKPWLFRMDETTISHVQIAHAGDLVDYDKKPGSIEWNIQGDPDFPVFLPKWSGTPLLLSGPRVNRVLAEEIEDPAAFGLEPPETMVRVSDRVGNTFEFHLGIPTPDGANQYARLVGDTALFTVPSVWADVVNRLATDPPWGRLYDLDISLVRVVEITHEDTTVAYLLDESTGQWGVAVTPEDTPQPVNEQWLDSLNLLGAPRVDKILARAIDDPAKYGLDPPLTRIRMGIKGTAPVEFHLGSLTPDGNHRYARVISTNDKNLYAILTTRLDTIDGLATDPPYADRSDGADDGESPSG